MNARRTPFLVCALVIVLVGCTRPEPDSEPAAASTLPDELMPEKQAPVEPGEVCGVARSLLGKHLARVDATCSVDADCALREDMQFDPCALPLPFAKRAERDVDALRDTVTSTRRLCDLVVSPCPAMVTHAACEAGRCVARSGTAPEPARAWEGALSSSDGPLRAARVHVEMFEQVQCVTTPCPAHNAGTLDVVADAAGVVRIGLDAEARMQPDYAMLTIAGYAPLRVRLGVTQAPVPLVLQKQ